jgi:choline dehydrogenase-like flavoprotein
MLHPDRKDRWGLPVALTVHNWSDNDRKASEYGAGIAKQVFAAGGADDIYATPLKSTHVMGSCRMGNDPAQSVVDPNCRTWDVPNLYVCDTSIMTTGGAVNPTLTAQAVALRMVDNLIAVAGRGEL